MCVVKFFSPQGINYNEGKGTNTEEWTKIKTKENVRRLTLATWENSKTKETAEKCIKGKKKDIRRNLKKEERTLQL